MGIKVTTNNHPRELRSLAELPSKDAEWFDYMEGEDAYSPRLVRYCGSWYDVSDSEALHDKPEFGARHGLRAAGWHGITTESYFSGVLFRYADERCETVVVGRYYCD